MTQLGKLGDRYEIEAHIGSGGMGAVYRAYDRDLGQYVALKMMLDRDGQPSQDLERFRREVRLARRVSHPNAARIHDLGRDGDRWFLTMELIEGETLAALLAREGSVPSAQACRIAAGVSAGLAAIHDAGIVHRDLKPSNILLTNNDDRDEVRAVVTDFGIAKAVDCTEESLTHGIIGTPGYMAPEQAMGSQPLDARCDVYALGVILYQMLSGHHPASQQTTTADQRLQWPPPLDPALPVALASLVHDCLARRPHQRPRDARDVEAALRAVIGEASKQPASLAGRTSQATIRGDAEPTTKCKRVLSVLPLRQRGGEEGLATSISEELVDLLAQNRELWVISLAASEHYRDAREPQRIGRELGADFVVDGTLQCQGDKLRVSVRLVDTGSGLQLWSERLTGELDDIFALQDRLAQIIAEHLRVELLTRPADHEPAAEAQTLYMCARGNLRQGPELVREAYDCLDAALAADPNFAAAAALRATAALRSWFFHSGDERGWEQLAFEAIAEASRLAPELSATHESQGVFAMHRGDYVTAVGAFMRALAIAPTNPVPLEYLGMLDIEIGQLDRGCARLERAHHLAPVVETPVMSLARTAALLGDEAGYRRWMAVLADLPGGELAHAATRMRVTAWRRDSVALAAHCWEAASLGRRSGQLLPLPQLLAGEGDIDALLLEARRYVQALSNRRYRCLLYQCLVDAACLHDRLQMAQTLLEDALASSLLDIVWLDRCPLLTALREQPAFAGLRQQLVDRVLQVPNRTTQVSGF